MSTTPGIVTKALIYYKCFSFFVLGHLRGVVFINAYIPLHSSDFTDVDLELFMDFMVEIRPDFPGDESIVMGDMNVNRFRTILYGNFRYFLTIFSLGIG